MSVVTVEGFAGSRGADLETDRTEGVSVLDPTVGSGSGAHRHGFDLTEAYLAHASSLLGVAVAALRDRARAEDVVQETFLRAWRARGSFDPRRGALRTWLFAIERNVIVDSVRSAARTPTVSLTADDDRATDDDRYAATVERLRLLRALATLSPEHREVVTAIHVRGLQYADLAEATGTPVATLRTRCFYALRSLRTFLDGEENR